MRSDKLDTPTVEETIRYTVTHVTQDDTESESEIAKFGVSIYLPM